MRRLPDRTALPFVRIASSIWLQWSGVSVGSFKPLDILPISRRRRGYSTCRTDHRFSHAIVAEERGDVATRPERAVITTANGAGEFNNGKTV
jgi:hypothetical protein